jgi:hypothetical protein
MRRKYFYILIPLFILSSCTAGRYSASGTDDVYRKGSAATYREKAPTQTSAPASSYRQPASEYLDRYYDEDSRYSYSSYSSRMQRFHGGYSNNYYSRLYISPGSFGYSWSPYGSTSFMYGGIGWNSWNYPRPYGGSWYDWHIYNYHTPLWSSWNSWSYYPTWFSPWYTNYWGGNSWNPWYGDYYHHYNTGNNNVKGYYGPRNWSGSNTPSGSGNIIERQQVPVYQYTPGQNSNFGRQVTPSGININKGPQPGAPAVQPQTPTTPSSPQPTAPRGNIKYYSPNTPSGPPVNQPSSPPPSKDSEKKTNPGGIQINRGGK